MRGADRRRRGHWQVFALLAFARLCSGAPATRPAQERYWEKDPVALRQEIDAFTSLQDGQPAAPGDWEMQLTSGWSTFSERRDGILIEPALKYTPHRYTESGYEFFENAQLSLRMPLDSGRGHIEGNGDMTFGWQERWLAATDCLPTISTLAEVRMPTGVDSNGADGTLTGILAQDFGPGTAYLNAWARTANGENLDNLRRFQWGWRTGYKWRAMERAALIADYVHESSRQEGHGNLNVLELALELRTKHHLSFGPGIFVGLDDHAETPNFGAGLRFVYLFNARPAPEAELSAGN